MDENKPCYLAFYLSITALIISVIPYETFLDPSHSLTGYLFWYEIPVNKWGWIFSLCAGVLSFFLAGKTKSWSGITRVISALAILLTLFSLEYLNRLPAFLISIILFIVLIFTAAAFLISRFLQKWLIKYILSLSVLSMIISFLYPTALIISYFAPDSFYEYIFGNHSIHAYLAVPCLCSGFTIAAASLFMLPRVTEKNVKYIVCVCSSLAIIAILAFILFIVYLARTFPHPS
jgi:hypothetical protein